MRAAAALVMLALAATAAPGRVPDEPAPYRLPRSAVLPVTATTGERYRIAVAWPEGAPPAAGWPVLYVLDGEDDFAIVALSARRLARAGGRSGVGEGIVVGIEAGPLARRVRDYTPATPGWTIPAGRPASGLATGGADAFLALIADIVQPAVRGRWPVDARRETLMGHSFGGLFALHAALIRPAPFDAVVAVSPSLWFGDGLVAREAARAVPATRILLAEHDGEAPAAETLVARLNRGAAGERARFLPLPGQSHGTTMLAAVAPAIAFAFAEPRR